MPSKSDIANTGRSSNMLYSSPKRGDGRKRFCTEICATNSATFPTTFTIGYHLRQLHQPPMRTCFRCHTAGHFIRAWLPPPATFIRPTEDTLDTNCKHMHNRNHSRWNRFTKRRTHRATGWTNRASARLFQQQWHQTAKWNPWNLYKGGHDTLTHQSKTTKQMTQMTA